MNLITAGAVIDVCGNAHTTAPRSARACRRSAEQRPTARNEAGQEWLVELTAGERLLENVWVETAARL